MFETKNSSMNWVTPIFPITFYAYGFTNTYKYVCTLFTVLHNNYNAVSIILKLKYEDLHNLQLAFMDKATSGMQTL